MIIRVKKTVRGFSLIELIAVMVLVGILSITLFSRLGSTGTAAVQSGRDDVIAALFFAQQKAMMRQGITVVITANSISVNENGNAIKVTSGYYPLTMPVGVRLAPVTTLTYDKLGRIILPVSIPGITLTGSGNSRDISASIRVEASGYAFAN